ncbi:nuclear transport factor 2 family protein [Nocardia sp. NPDC052254]|uniref:nuclear transport factor 2 family protein n=1 Tax=Nocardia sp. NPDC052254 TaxID=3155681 RepID=UPI00341BFB72
MSELAELRQRLARIEDERAIERLIASYGPLVDSGSVEATAALWSQEGTYDVEDWQMRGRADVAAMVGSDAHQGLIGRGCLHFHGPAVVTVDGDDAVAVCESVLVVRHESRNVVARTGANHFRLRRIADRWQITARVTRTLDGDAGARELLTTGIEGR